MKRMNSGCLLLLFASQHSKQQSELSTTKIVAAATMSNRQSIITFVYNLMNITR